MSVFVGSVTIFHLQPQAVQIQVASSRGLPKLILTGRSSSSLRSTRERLLSILKTQKIRLKSLRTTISLTPALPVSTESHLDLALLVSLLADYHLYQPNSEDCFLGEVDLDGRLRSTQDLFYLVWAASSLGYKKVFLPQKSCQKLGFVKNIELIGIDHL
ncbi:MAG TPA: magnesium chelatase domain-containing protein, partial [Candidatus Woesebacteria bacterium]|nr:magnesium chelatase domain-containing protein [Candidatus Woesebacteria bacterium]